jgi:hypothetical protein
MSDDNKSIVRKPGRPVGSQNKKTAFIKAIGEDNAEAIIKKTVELAKEGKAWAVQIVLERLYPPARNRLVQFPLPPLNTLDDVQRAIGAMLEGVAGGMLTIEEGGQLSEILERHGKAINDADLERRLETVEKLLADRADC